MKKGIFILLVMAFSLTILSQGVANAAGTVNTTLGVSASAITVCTISAGGTGYLAFPTYQIGGDSDVVGTGTVNVNCSVGQAYNVFVGQGNNYDTTRRMNDGFGNFMAYEIYADVGRVNIWGGDTSGGAATYQSGTGSGSSQTHTLYGKVDKGQAIGNGSYGDAVVVSVAW